MPVRARGRLIVETETGRIVGHLQQLLWLRRLPELGMPLDMVGGPRGSVRGREGQKGDVVVQGEGDDERSLTEIPQSIFRWIKTLS